MKEITADKARAVVSVIAHKDNPVSAFDLLLSKYAHLFDMEDCKNDSKAKYCYATEIGISVDTWKQCLCAMLMGGYVPEVRRQKQYYVGTFYVGSGLYWSNSAYRL